MGNTKQFVWVALIVGAAISWRFGIWRFLMYCVFSSWVAALVYHFSRSMTQYPTRLVYELFKSNPLHKGRDTAEGLVIVVTGSTSGIGQRVAEELYRYGATVVVAARNREKAEATIADIKASSPACTGKLVFGKLDTSNLSSVVEFVEWFNQNFDHLEYLVNNAGIQYGNLENNPITNANANITSKDGYDLCFATNYLGHFLLSHLLLPKITGKVVNIASCFHFQVDGSTLNPKSGPNGSVPKASVANGDDFRHKLEAYGATKLANVFHAVELQKRMESMGYGHVKAVSVCPGWVRTHMLPDDAMGHFVHTHSFTLDEGILSTMCSMFSHDLKGGEFIANHIVPLSSYSWFDQMWEFLTKKDLRGKALILLSLGVLYFQSQSYGFNVHRKSPECENSELTAALYDWTMDELQKKGFIKK